MRRLHSGGCRHFYHLFDLSKNHQNDGFCSLWGLLTYLTTIKLIKIFLHANSELCSSHTALFQATFVICFRTLIFNDFLIKNNGKSIYRVLGTICIFLIRKNHEISTSQRICRWFGALCLIIFVFLFELECCISYLWVVI